MLSFIILSLGIYLMAISPVNTFISPYLKSPWEMDQPPRILINEIMFDPFPQKGLPGLEYIELFNADSREVNLINWTLNGALLPEYYFKPGDYLIVCKSYEETEFRPFGNTIGIAPWDVLNNDGQQVILKDNAEIIIDQIEYSPDMIGDKNKKEGGWSLELINPLYPCKGIANWGVSLDPEGGTPGRENSVYDNQPDHDPPLIVGQGWQSPDTMYLNFSEPIEIYSVRHFTFNPPLGIRSIIRNDGYPFSLFLFPENRISKGISYSLHISGISDCAGNSIRDTLFTTGIGKEPAFLDLLITELMVDETPSIGMPESEYIEIYNSSDQLLSLGGILFIHGNDTILLPESVLMQEQYIVLCPRTRTDHFPDIQGLIGLRPFPRLLNEGQTLALINPHHQLIFSMRYEKSWYRDLEKSEGGYALEMIDIQNPCGDEHNWKASDSHQGGTPGKMNSVSGANPDRSGPGIRSVYASDPALIEVTLTEKLDPSSLNNLTVTVSGQVDSKILSFDSLFYNRFSVSLAHPLSHQIRYEIYLEGIRDCVGNTSNPDEIHFQFYLPRKAVKGDLLINEIMFNPKPGGKDWVEIINNSESYIDPADVRLGTFSGDSIEIMANIIHNHQLIPPSGFLVITEDKDKLIADFPNSLPECISQIEKMPVLPDQLGNIALITNENLILDFLRYSSDYHHKLITNDEGISLERISTNDSTNNPANWHSASSVAGYGTPTRVNSSRATTGTGPDIITLEPEIITPDSDGFQDQLLIHYETGSPGYSANVEIYSIRGQHVKSLLRNKLIATEGTLIWDGYSDKNQLPPTGIYILLFEMYNLQGDYRRIKKRFVVVKRS